MNKSESKYFNTAEKMDKAFLSILEKKDLEFITVKEICSLAGVNRSTFYLHYETIADLLNESVEYINSRFLDYFDKNSEAFISKINTCSVEELYLITPEYLKPYLNYIKDNKRLFKTFVQKSETLGLHASYKGMYNYVISPILKRLNVPEKDGEYIVRFYIGGIMSVVTVWLESDCEESVEYILSLILQCFPNNLKNGEEK